MKIPYKKFKFGVQTMVIISRANTIVDEYLAKGFRLTLRQLYYQFVSRGLSENTTQAYKRIGSIINDGRLAGLIDWDAIEDRTREMTRNAHWNSPKEIVESCAQQFRIDKWKPQEYRPEVWIEKEALAGLVDGICRELDIPYLSCRGYTSQSEMWSSAMRMKSHLLAGQQPLIIHLGDHDPSGIDMTRDIEDRLGMFVGMAGDVELRRIALNMDQIESYNPPPNPAKVTDSRYADYAKKYGDESWELDALDPSIIVDMIRGEVEAVMNEDKWEESIETENEGKKQLEQAAKKMKTKTTKETV